MSEWGNGQPVRASAEPILKTPRGTGPRSPEIAAADIPRAYPSRTKPPDWNDRFLHHFARAYARRKRGTGMLRAVTFDLWQTLILDRPEGLRQARAGRVQGMHDVLVRRGHALSVDEVERAYDAVGEHLETLWKTQRDIGTRGQVRLLLGVLGLYGVLARDEPVMAALEEAYGLPILSALPVANAGAAEVLETLSARGLVLALICNTGRTPGSLLRIVLERLGLGRFLSVLTFSDELGLRKPHAEIFLRTLAALGVPAAEAAHVGDDVTTDVAGARAAGMRAIHLCHPDGASRRSDGAEAIASLAALPAALFAAR
jgi:putative hydrolase of the HAD superfamily